MRTIPIALSVALVLATCGGAVTPVTRPEPSGAAPSPGATLASSAEPSDGSYTFSVATGSSATVRVREQLANVQAPNDAILKTSSLSGQFTLLPDGTFTADSEITVSLSTLASDSNQRDGFIKRSTLQTDRYPTAAFRPLRVSGLALPLAAGDVTFTLSGNMTIHGVTKSVTFTARGRASSSDLTLSLANAPSWRFGDFGMSVPSSLLVLSVVDEIRLQVDLAATAA